MLFLHSELGVAEDSLLKDGLEDVFVPAMNYT